MLPIEVLVHGLDLCHGVVHWLTGKECVRGDWVGLQAPRDGSAHTIEVYRLASFFSHVHLYIQQYKRSAHGHQTARCFKGTGILHGNSLHAYYDSKDAGHEQAGVMILLRGSEEESLEPVVQVEYLEKHTFMRSRRIISKRAVFCLSRVRLSVRQRLRLCFHRLLFKDYDEARAFCTAQLPGLFGTSAPSGTERPGHNGKALPQGSEGSRDGGKPEAQ